MRNFVYLGLAMAFAACTTPHASWAAPSKVCTNTYAVQIEQGGPKANPIEGIYPIPDIQVPGPDINSPAKELGWTRLGNTSEKLTAHCYAGLFDAEPTTSVTLPAGVQKCIMTGGALNCE